MASLKIIFVHWSRASDLFEGIPSLPCGKTEVLSLFSSFGAFMIVQTPYCCCWISILLWSWTLLSSLWIVESELCMCLALGRWYLSFQETSSKVFRFSFGCPTSEKYRSNWCDRRHLWKWRIAVFEEGSRNMGFQVLPSTSLSSQEGNSLLYSNSLETTYLSLTDFWTLQHFYPDEVFLQCSWNLYLLGIAHLNIILIYFYSGLACHLSSPSCHTSSLALPSSSPGCFSWEERSRPCLSQCTLSWTSRIFLKSECSGSGGSAPWKGEAPPKDCRTPPWEQSWGYTFYPWWRRRTPRSFLLLCSPRIYKAFLCSK